MTSQGPRGTTPPVAPHGGLRGGSSDARLRHDLSTNVNPYGPPPCVIESARAANLSAYPDPTSLAARACAAQHWHRPIDELAFGAGVSELLPALFAAVLRRDDRVVLAAPLYGEYARAAQLADAKTVGVTRRSTMPYVNRLLAALRRHTPRVLVIVAPGNPLGDAWTRDDLALLANAAAERDCLLVIDQSYDAFLDQPLGDPALPGHPAVVHLRSLTKDFAIAGLRAAYAIGPAPVMTQLEAQRAPWAASTPAQAAAIASFSADAQQHVQQTTRALRRDALAFTEALRTIGAGIRMTDVHWVLCSLSVAQAARLEQAAGIRVRTLEDHLLTGLARIAAPIPALQAEVVSAIATALRLHSPSTDLS